MTGLIYQVVWSRMLTLVFGATTAAVSTVLAVFMGGLALGARIAGRRADAVVRPLLVYGLLELGIGLWGLLTPALLTAYTPLYRAGWRMSEGSEPTLLAMRMLLSVVAMLPSTALMGASLPILSRLCAERREALGGRIGTLYGANLLGAAGGAFLAGFALLPSLGTSRTLGATAAVNFALFGVALLLDRQAAGRLLQPPASRQASVLAVGSIRGPDRSLHLVLIGFGISGAVALLYEVAWTRALGLIVGSSTLAFALMLTTFLLGLFGGTVAAAAVADRLPRPLASLAWAEAATGAGTWLGLYWFAQLPWLNLASIEESGSGHGVAFWSRFGLIALVLSPTALCLGALFPLAVRAAGPALERVGRTVGDLYASNTIGAIVGALAAGFLMIPRLGTQGALRAGMAINVLLGLALLAAGRREVDGEAGEASDARAGRNRRRLAMTGMAALLAGVVWPVRWDELTILMAQTSRRTVSAYVRQYQKRPFVSQADFEDQLRSQQQILFHAEGATSDVAVVKNPMETNLLTNGHADASDNPDMPTQIALGALPMLLHRDAAEVAVIGWGSGVTGGVTEQFPLRRLTALELEPQVLRAADLFRAVNHDSLRDPRLRIVVADGRNYFLGTEAQFDVIVSEPSNLWQAGVCNLFTLDFFRLCRARLRPGGLFTQWIGYGSAPPGEVRGILAALREVFAGVLLFEVDSTDAVVVASERPFRLDAASLEAKFRAAGPTLRADLERAGIQDVAHLIARLALAPDDISAFVRGERPNTDDNARAEFAVAAAHETPSDGAWARPAFAAARAGDPLKDVDVTGIPAPALREEVIRLREASGAPPRQ